MIQFLKTLFGQQGRPQRLFRLKHLDPANATPPDQPDDTEKQKAMIQSLLDKADSYEAERERFITRLERHNQILTETMKAAGGYIWRKDCNNRFVWCDPSFCKTFFAVENMDCTHEIEGTPEETLFKHFEQKTGQINHFRAICRATDEHCKDRGQKCRYIEVGYVGDCLTILDVIKTPLLREADKGGIVGFAIDRTVNQEQIRGLLKQGGKAGYVERIAKAAGAKAYWVRDPDTEECAELFESITVTADFFK